MNQALLSNTFLPCEDAVFRNCVSCGMRELCLPAGLDEEDTKYLDSIISRRKVSRDKHLYRTGDSFNSLYAIRVGHFKTYQISSDGGTQINGFQMIGDLLGMDAINSSAYQCNAVALEDSEVCEIPFSKLEMLFSRMPSLLRHFHHIMSEEIVSQQNIILVLGNMSVEQRFAAFLVNLSVRYAARGYSATCFQLRMMRSDIGNYLGLTSESVSRVISKLRQNGVIEVRHREVQILDPLALSRLAAGM
ncbi:fumarate/nitrate reduction transcriptional regulator Fnr [Herbaspirillum sp. RV1423]|uniref:fumarate/nitrate reduction transcriptional regulator Fnr n=1 Tax=Herbaspirillum sp. RV1423 TaxID=1443993 RepID=UPI0005573467|nr:fumarate/nitrate reduction transcriptional regulator Fnr [Herbaspirillum sp. RV1423]